MTVPTLPPSEEAVQTMPERIFLGCANTDNEHQVWTDEGEGGTEYVRADLAAVQVKSKFKGTVDGDTELQAAARHAGWALIEPVDEIDWIKREQVSDIITRLGIALNELSAARELALEEAARLCDARAEQCAEEHQAATLASIKAALAGARSEAMHLAHSIRALSSPNHADAGKVEGDGRADLERFWRPISEADKSITFNQTFDLGDGEKMTIRNSDHYWVRDEDGRVYEATWSDHKGGYWWDLEGDSPVDPVEYMPHPLSLPLAPPLEATKP